MKTNKSKAAPKKMTCHFSHGRTVEIERMYGAVEDTISMSFGNGINYLMSEAEASLLASAMRTVLGQERPLEPKERFVIR